MPGHSILRLTIVTLLVASSVALALRGTVLAQEGPQVTSLLVKELPTDPNSTIWKEAPVADVPLVPQAVVLPRIMEVSVPTVSVRSVNDGQRVAFLLEWADKTRDVRATRPDEFRAPADFASAEARQYLVGTAAGNPLARPDKTSPVEALISNGFGTATHQAQQDVEGRGIWADGRWRVTFTRTLAASGPESANLAGRADVPAAFAVWNGSNQEVGARKQLSGLVTVRLAPGAAGSQGGAAQTWWPYAAAGVFILAGAGLAIGLRRRQSGQ